MHYSVPPVSDVNANFTNLKFCPKGIFFFNIKVKKLFIPSKIKFIFL